MGQIYCLTNKVNGKKYVGKTNINIEHRWMNHLRDRNKKTYGSYPLYKAIEKYGSSSFELSVLEECDVNLLDEREIFWINELDTYNNGYNLTLGGGGYCKVDEEKESLIIKRYLQTGNYTMVGREFGVTGSTVSNYIKKNNIKFEGNKTSKPKITPKSVFVNEIGKEFCNFTECAKYLSNKMGVDWKKIQTSISSRSKGLIKPNTPYNGYTFHFFKTSP
jgi:group I intron endonuclease